MNKFKLRLKGFIGIKRGLGLDEITIDFSEVSGLTAFDGMNGAGKSTVLENLHPYSTLASRSGALYQHVFLRNAEKEFSFSYNGNHYRTLLKIDCQSGKSEGFIYKNGATKSETTGKIREYDKYITSLLGTENMFFHSVFCAQNATKLSDMTTGELKTLLSEFLNLNKLVEYEANAKDEMTAVFGKVEQVDKQLLVLNNKLAGYDTIKENLARERYNLVGYEEIRDELKKRREMFAKELDVMRETKSAQAVLIAQKANIEAKIKELEAQLGKELEANDAELAALRMAYKGFQAEIKKNEELLKQADEINAAADKEQYLITAIDNLTKIIDDKTSEQTDWQLKLNESMADLSCVQGGINDCEKDIVKWKSNHEVKALQNSIDQAIKQSEILEKRDPNCQSSTCSFIVAALKAKDELPQLGIELGIKHNEMSENLAWLNNLFASLKDERITLEGKIENYKKEIARICELITAARKDLATCRFDFTKVKELAGKKTALAVAQTQYDNVTKQIEENVTKGKEIKVKWENRKSDLDGSINDAKAQLADIQIDTEIESRIELTTKDIADLDKALSDNETNINSTRALIMKYEADLSARAEVEKEIAAANVEKNKLLQDISDWTYLKNACGKNGLQAMEIDGAAPIITDFANDLLTQAFGPLFAVKFKTINDEGKECLDIIVISEDGEEILLDNLSGGQRVWILMALRLAMTLLSKEKSGRNFETFYADELDGALDPENALNFVNMYRSFMKAGGFIDGYFISHKPSCRALADNNLMFAPGNSPAWN